jgi:hypothetical protein
MPAKELVVTGSADAWTAVVQVLIALEGKKEGLDNA